MQADDFAVVVHSMSAPFSSGCESDDDAFLFGINAENDIAAKQPVLTDF